MGTRSAVLDRESGRVVGGSGLSRAADHPLDDVAWADRPPIALRIRRTDSDLEDLILDVRRTLRDESVLGKFGPAAIRRELERREPDARLPSIRTMARILGELPYEPPERWFK